VNPKIIESSIKKTALQGGEGCLSVDKNHKGLVHRNYKIKMKAYNALINEEVIITATGYLAIVLQHEYDHLDGRFFYDRIDKNNPFTPLNGEEII
jgi:peptide deformylase